MPWRPGEALDFDAHHGAAHDRQAASLPPALVVEPGVQPMPRAHLHRAIAGIVRLELGVGGGPRFGLGQREPGAVARPASGRARRPYWRVVVKDPSRADAHHDLGVDVGEFGAQGDGVVAGVEHERGRGIRYGEAGHEAADLRNGRRRGVLAGLEAHHVDGGSPRVRRPVELADPLIAPACDDGPTRGAHRR